MFLCNICNSANGASFPVGKCYVCDDKALKTDEMLSKAAAMLKNEKLHTFSISSVIPKDWLSREEKIWDSRVKGAESIKNFINHRAVAAIRHETGLRYDGDGNCRVVLDYSDGSVCLQMNELFVFGRYKKLSAGLSQSRWKCSKCDGKGCPACSGKGKLYESVEERIGEPFKIHAQADDYVMHASGREDVDATNSAGRAFVLEIKNPKKREIRLDSIMREIASGKEVEVLDLRVVPRSFVEVVTESHFDKTYEAETEFGRELTYPDHEKIRSLEGKTLLQQTPTRVSHRRADLVRHRKVKQIEVVNAKGNFATLIIKAEAGTYIKELISGDKGRTKPSVAELLGASASCKKLAVTMIDDGFLDSIRT